MRYRPLGKTQRSLSSVGLGAMPLAIEKRPAEADAIRVALAAFEAGVNWIDVADSYCLGEEDTGYAERLAGKAIAEFPAGSQRLMVTTKGGYTRHGGGWQINARPEHLRAAVEQSLRSLGVDSIFLYQLHAPDPAVYFPDSFGALAELRRAGKIQHLGVCNVDVGHLRDAHKIAPVISVQNRCNVYERHSFDNGVVEWCERNGAAFIAHSAVGGHQGHVKVPTDATLRAIGQRLGVSPYQVALAWLLAQSTSLFVIPGATKLESARSSAAAADVHLPGAELAELAHAFPRANRALQALVAVRTRVRHFKRTRATRPRA